MVGSSSQCTEMTRSVEENILRKTASSSTNMFPVEDPKKSFKPATLVLSKRATSSKLSFVPPNIKE